MEITDLQDILEKIQFANDKVQRIETSSVMSWDKTSLLHRIQSEARELYENTRDSVLYR